MAKRAREGRLAGMARLLRHVLLGGLSCAGAGGAGAQPSLEVVEVRASGTDPAGVADSATEGTVRAPQLENRPLLRPAEVLEAVPGLIISQHSGDGKANQYYLRGFNLDHGTDFATWLMGMPVNMPSHAHGQGYADLQFLIPELVEHMQYRKGPYAAEDGDFSAAGSARIDYFRRLPGRFGELTAGQKGYRRGLVAGSPEVGAGNLLYAFEWSGNDGPWQVPEDYRKLNGVLRFSAGSVDDGFALTAMAYDGRWRATDQIPRRALDGGLISRFGAIDPTDGGQTRRYSLSGEWARSEASRQTRASAYYIRSALSLYSNFEYNLGFPPPYGDQFEQSESRQVAGFDASRTWFGRWAGHDTEDTLGVHGRLDDISPLGLYRSIAQRRSEKVDYSGHVLPALIREDRVREGSVALYGRHMTIWSDSFRSIAGLRADFYRFQVDSSLAQNSGRVSDHLLSPKLALIFGPWAGTEYYLNLGYGFHSNDARGTTIRIDPASGEAATPVTPLVRARGYEFGIRSAILPGVRTSLALWRLDLASELVFKGDAGSTSPSFASQRSGLEGSADWVPLRGLTVDADFSVSRARYTDVDPARAPGPYIPGAIEKTLSVGATWQDGRPWSGGLRLRYVGSRPLLEDNTVRAPSSTLTHLRVAWRLDREWRFALDVLNLFDRRVSDIDYFYASRLPFEAAPVEDVHTHPAEPRALRLSARRGF